MNFSFRTVWQQQHNSLTVTLEQKQKNGCPVLDLTVSNPTECGFQYPEKEILHALSNPESLIYQPEPRGLHSARLAIAEYYQQKKVFVEPSNIFLTSSTSEAYSHLFKLLCNSGDSVLVPQPSYPLFEYLAQVNDVRLHYYHLHYNDEWMIDIQSIRKAINPQTKAIVLINPHNPTGSFLKQHELESIKQIAREYSLALIVDEVFIDYPFDETMEIISTAGTTDVLTFTLNGISKMCGLPQMKLGWFVVGGSGFDVKEACERLEVLCDTFLSVNTPVQIALPQLFVSGKNIQTQIRNRIKANYTTLHSLPTHHSPITVHQTDGGWYGILRVPQTKTDEEWAVALLEERNVHLFPGYFFDIQTESCLVVSLLVEEQTFREGIEQIKTFIAEHL